MNPDAYEHHRVPNVPANQFHGHVLVSDQVSKHDVGVVWRELEKVLDAGIPGAITEFGCYVGTTSLFIRRLLDVRGETERPFHVYDSFEGLPNKSTQDNNAAGVDFQAGKLSVSKKEFLHQFRAASLRPPVVHKGWFDNFSDTDVPNPIALAFLDGDFYGSILTSLQLAWPRMTQGGIVLIDDYQRTELPGVERAVRDFFYDKTMPPLRAEHNIAILIKS